MGYGIKDATRRFPPRLRYAFRGDLRHSLFAEGMKPWVDTSIVAFEEVASPDAADFIVDVNDSQSLWRSGDNFNGRAERVGATGKGELLLMRAHKVGDLIHEFGHLLGLCHEQDRQGCEHAKAWRKKLLASGKYAFFQEVCDSADQKSVRYGSYGDFDDASIMLYGSGYASRSAISAGDKSALQAIYALR